MLGNRFSLDSLLRIFRLGEKVPAGFATVKRCLLSLIREEGLSVSQQGQGQGH